MSETRVRPGPSPASRPAPTNFADRLIGRIRDLGHPLCVGLDPHLAPIPPLFQQGSMAPDDERTAPAVEAFLAARPDFSLLPAAAVWAETVVPAGIPAGAAAAPAAAPGPAPFDGPYLLLSPARHGTDGFFAAILERRKKP